MYGKISDPGMAFFSPQVAQAARTPANQQSTGGNGVSTPCGEVSIRGTTVFVPGALELYMYGRVSDPGMRFLIRR